MERAGSTSWHRRLFAWASLYCALPTERAPDAILYLFTITLAGLYLIIAAILWIILNAGTLLLGLYFPPAWKLDTQLQILFLPGRIPIVAIAVPVLLVYGFFRCWLADGFLIAIAPFGVTIGGGFGLFGLCIFMKFLRRKLQHRSA